MKPGYKPRHLLICCLLAFHATPPADAAALSDALDQAWARHPQAGALDARGDAAKAASDMATALTPGPAKLSLGHLDDRIGGNRGKREWEIELAAPLWLPGQKNAQTTEAASVQRQIDSSGALLRLELAEELRAAWWALAAARQASDLAQRRLTSARALEADVMRRYQVGDLARVDANRARGETLAAQVDSLSAQAALRQAERVWRGLTGMAAPTRLEAEEVPGLSDSLAKHPRLSALSSAVGLANARLELARVTRRDAPELALRVLRERGDERDDYDNAIGIKLTIPLTSGPRLRRDDATARAEAHQSEAEHLLATQRLALDVEQARLDLETAQQQWTLARARHEFSGDTLALAEKAFTLGESDLSELLRARAAAFEAEALLNHQSTARGLAVSQLRQALGQLP